MMYMITMALKVFGLAFGWYILRQTIRDGGETARTIMQTVSMAIRTWCMGIQAKLWLRLKEKGGDVNEEVTEEIEGNGTVNRRSLLFLSQRHSMDKECDGGAKTAAKR